MKPIISELEREIYSIACASGITRESRALIMAAGAVANGAATLSEVIERLQDSTLAGFNLPTKDGTECGKQMSEFLKIDPSKCCSSCAYRKGSVPNQCPSTINDALTCAASGEPFYCHQTGMECAGWKQTQEAKR